MLAVLIFQQLQHVQEQCKTTRSLGIKTGSISTMDRALCSRSHWTLKDNNSRMINTFQLPQTAIHPVTNLLEIIRINDKSSARAAQQLSNCWLVSRYPWPTRVELHGNGGEFIGWNFQSLLRQLGIQSVPTSTAKNPQSNAIIERLRQTMGDIPRVMLHINPPRNEKNDANQIVENSLLAATCVHLFRCAVNHTMQTSPGALVFQRGMMMNVPLIVANLYSIQQRR